MKMEKPLVSSAKHTIRSREGLKRVMVVKKKKRKNGEQCTNLKMLIKEQKLSQQAFQYTLKPCWPTD